ncbi:MAG: OmpA family protein [Syntrophomonadaceae bacterium]|nr:OmpA family protein [Syntrophomonadaceae bacterium]
MARRSKKKQQAAEEGPSMERWLLTYSDLITLLMIFFVVMYTMSQVDAKKFEAVANSLSVVLSGKSISILDTAGPSVVEGRSGQIAREGPGEDPSLQGNLEAIEKQLAEYIKQEEGLAGNVIIMNQERGLVISLKDTLLFPKGSDELTPHAREIIRKVGGSLKTIPNYIRVEGHTDNLPIRTARFPSNWELSVLRATKVVHVLNEEVGIPAARLSATGYGEYRSLVPNDTEVNRSMNRRVDIVILKQKYDYFEPPLLIH